MISSHARIDIRHPEHNLPHAITGLEPPVRVYDRVGLHDGVDDRP